ncbi:hypothetical protein SDRG_00470 [Saprolegnia diclina VS20]|uniref:Uncharacterized protein n=1 Tax=Saprolegnia diclina (strain VS20) TaxID=1156394 RepID=T0SII8_SAPDV|nr:hypothetical protein SDRG_00470 [Saprolegnia diclina VS20]EQC42747.1 hypothetical protein SDRG_00470 [Saprolegnia diclina VS20]|eukprot:XP_008604170.1 hypothetical protein SDRG_00470 [Saprolegnia diclina VS20]
MMMDGQANDVDDRQAAVDEAFAQACARASERIWNSRAWTRNASVRAASLAFRLPPWSSGRASISYSWNVVSLLLPA